MNEGLTVLFPEVPSGPPVISGTVRDRFHVGEEVNINCTSSDSYPAAELIWYINDVQVN